SQQGAHAGRDARPATWIRFQAARYRRAQPVGRKPAKARAWKMAQPRTKDTLAGRTDARHRSWRQAGNLSGDPPPQRRGHGGDPDLVRSRRGGRAFRPCPGDGARSPDRRSRRPRCHGRADSELDLRGRKPRHRRRSKLMSKVGALGPGPAPQAANWRAQLPTLIRVYGIVLTLLLLLTVVTIGNPAFISQQNVFNMASQWAPAGIMAVGMTFVILTGGFDLSLASAYSLCGAGAAYVGQAPTAVISF